MQIQYNIQRKAREHKEKKHTKNTSYTPRKGITESTIKQILAKETFTDQYEFRFDPYTTPVLHRVVGSQRAHLQRP